jgi:hypothetical protein
MDKAYSKYRDQSPKRRDNQKISAAWLTDTSIESEKFKKN